MTCEDEEQDRIDEEIAKADWCDACHAPIGLGRCDGCIAVAASIADEGQPQLRRRG